MVLGLSAQSDTRQILLAWLLCPPDPHQVHHWAAEGGISLALVQRASRVAPVVVAAGNLCGENSIWNPESTKMRSRPQTSETAGIFIRDVRQIAKPARVCVCACVCARVRACDRAAAKHHLNPEP